MEAQRLAALRFQTDGIVQSGLTGERLGQRRHAAIAGGVKIGDGCSPIALDRRMRALGETVADKQDRACRRCCSRYWRRLLGDSRRRTERRGAVRSTSSRSTPTTGSELPL
jgi:hypothetical protein